MKKALLFSFILTCICLTNYAQTNNNWRLYSGSNEQAEDTYNQQGRFYSQSGIRVIQSPEIVALSERFKDENKKHPTIQGYRVQVFLGERAQASEIKTAFDKDHTDIKADITYLAPNFRVRAGAFRTQIEAEAFHQKIKAKYSNSYVVPDKISVTEFE